MKRGGVYTSRSEIDAALRLQQNLRPRLLAVQRLRQEIEVHVRWPALEESLSQDIERLRARVEQK